MGSLSLLQGIFPTQGSNPGLPHCGRILYQLSHKGKGRNGKDLTEAEDIKKRWQEYTEELHKKGFNDPDNHDGVIIHLEPDFLECKVK